MLQRILRFFGFRRPTFSNSPVFIVPKGVTSLRIYVQGGGGGGSGIESVTKTKEEEK
jgi:hypothetical protein